MAAWNTTSITSRAKLYDPSGFEVGRCCLEFLAILKVTLRTPFLQARQGLIFLLSLGSLVAAHAAYLQPVVDNMQKTADALCAGEKNFTSFQDAAGLVMVLDGPAPPEDDQGSYAYRAVLQATQLEDVHSEVLAAHVQNPALRGLAMQLKSMTFEERNNFWPLCQDMDSSAYGGFGLLHTESATEQTLKGLFPDAGLVGGCPAFRSLALCVVSSCLFAWNHLGHLKCEQTVFIFCPCFPLTEEATASTAACLCRAFGIWGPCALWHAAVPAKRVASWQTCHPLVVPRRVPLICGLIHCLKWWRPTLLGSLKTLDWPPCQVCKSLFEQSVANLTCTDRDAEEWVSDLEATGAVCFGHVWKGLNMFRFSCICRGGEDPAFKRYANGLAQRKGLLSNFSRCSDFSKPVTIDGSVFNFCTQSYELRKMGFQSATFLGEMRGFLL